MPHNLSMFLNFGILYAEYRIHMTLSQEFNSLFIKCIAVQKMSYESTKLKLICVILCNHIQ